MTRTSAAHAIVAWMAVVGPLGCSTGTTGSMPPTERTTRQGVSLTGERLDARPSEDTRRVQEPLLAEARALRDRDPDDIEAWIWVGRRLGYLQEYQEAIATYTEAIAKAPDDPRLYRHRGHRFISVRELEQAIRDLDHAGRLIEGTEDEVEPDGLPNARGIPTSTLHFNIWYHLALAHYLAGDYEQALDAYERCLEVSTNPDALVATSYWMYMTLRRLGRDAAADRILDPINDGLDIIENGSYRDLLLLFKGERTAEEVVPPGEDSLAGATTLYGVAEWHRHQGRPEEAERILTRVVQMRGQWSAFGYIAAEADVAR